MSTSLRLAAFGDDSPSFPARISVSTSLGLAAFGARRPRGGRVAIPAAFKYELAVSRRTPVAASMRRSVHPSRPSAKICCRFSSLKTLLISPRLGTRPFRERQTSWPTTTGRFSAAHNWPVLGAHRGLGQCQPAFARNLGVRLEQLVRLDDAVQRVERDALALQQRVEGKSGRVPCRRSPLPSKVRIASAEFVAASLALLATSVRT